MALRTLPIHRVFTRPNLVLGGDRELVIMSGVVAFALVFTGMTWVSFGYGVVLWVVSLFVCQAMARADPLMRYVYLRHRLYALYYPPRSTPYRDNLREYK